MPVQIELIDLPESTQFAPLGVLGYCLMRREFLQVVFEGIEFKQKTVTHHPAAKVLDTLVSILAGCRSISAINTRIRPDFVLAQAWHRHQFAEQSTIARTIDAFTEQQVSQLRMGIDRLYKREGAMWNHDLRRKKLWLDLDLTPMPTSKRAQGSRKGKMGDKKTVMVVNSPD